MMLFASEKGEPGRQDFSPANHNSPIGCVKCTAADEYGALQTWGRQDTITIVGMFWRSTFRVYATRTMTGLMLWCDGQSLAERVPRLEKVDAELLADGRLLLEIKDAPFERPILAKFASDGTLKMLSYLIILYDPTPPPLIGIEEPENHIHPRLLPGLAEECRSASTRSQLMITSHSPYFVDGLRPEELWALWTWLKRNPLRPL